MTVYFQTSIGNEEHRLCEFASCKGTVLGNLLYIIHLQFMQKPLNKLSNYI